MLLNAVLLKRANDEKSSYVSKDRATKSYRFVSKIYNQFVFIHLTCCREQLNKQINDAEARIKSNREKQKVTKDVQIDGSKQLKYWRDLLRMMELKRKLATVNEENFPINVFVWILF
jgi:hypothetical protein